MIATNSTPRTQPTTLPPSTTITTPLFDICYKESTTILTTLSQNQDDHITTISSLVEQQLPSSDNEDNIIPATATATSSHYNGSILPLISTVLAEPRMGAHASTDILTGGISPSASSESTVSPLLCTTVEEEVAHVVVPISHNENVEVDEDDNAQHHYAEMAAETAVKNWEAEVVRHSKAQERAVTRTNDTDAVDGATNSYNGGSITDDKSGNCFYYCFDNNLVNVITASFVYKLFGLLQHKRINLGLLQWNEAGDAFFVKDINEFSQRVLPRFFRHSNWASFVRQLNIYGFHKMPEGQFVSCDNDTGLRIDDDEEIVGSENDGAIHSSPSDPSQIPSNGSENTSNHQHGKRKKRRAAKQFNGFWHPFFVRDRPHQLKDIKRKSKLPPPLQKGKIRSSASASTLDLSPTRSYDTLPKPPSQPVPRSQVVSSHHQAHHSHSPHQNIQQHQSRHRHHHPHHYHPYFHHQQHPHPYPHYDYQSVPLPSPASALSPTKYHTESSSFHSPSYPHHHHPTGTSSNYVTSTTNPARSYPYHSRTLSNTHGRTITGSTSPHQRSSEEFYHGSEFVTESTKYSHHHYGWPSSTSRSLTAALPSCVASMTPSSFTSGATWQHVPIYSGSTEYRIPSSSSSTTMSTLLMPVNSNGSGSSSIERQQSFPPSHDDLHPVTSIPRKTTAVPAMSNPLPIASRHHASVSPSASTLENGIQLLPLSPTKSAIESIRYCLRDLTASLHLQSRYSADCAELTCHIASDYLPQDYVDLAVRLTADVKQNELKLTNLIKLLERHCRR